MPTSGSTNFNLNRNQIIQTALKLIGVTGAEENMAASDLSLGSDLLNMMIKYWEADGCTLWVREEGTLFLTVGQSTYSLGNGAKAAKTSTSVQTTLSAAGAISATSVTCTTVTGMTVGDNIGIVLSSGSIHWTTITSINTVTKVVGLTTALVSAAASGTNVYVYTTALTRPYDVTHVRFMNAGGMERTLEHYHHDQYYDIANKTQQAQPNAWTYQAKISDSQLILWPCPDSSLTRVNFTYLRTLEDFDSATDAPDFPQEFLLPLTYNLACLLAPVYGKDEKVLRGLRQTADILYKQAKAFNSDTGPLYLVPGPN